MPMTSAKRTAGVLGASGYAGGELLRLLARHPGLQVAWAAGDRQRGQPLADRYPGLRAAYGELAFCSLEEGLDKEHPGIIRPGVEEAPALALRFLKSTQDHEPAGQLLTELAERRP